MVQFIEITIWPRVYADIMFFKIVFTSLVLLFKPLFIPNKIIFIIGKTLMLHDSVFEHLTSKERYQSPPAVTEISLHIRYQLIELFG